MQEIRNIPGKSKLEQLRERDAALLKKEAPTGNKQVKTSEQQIIELIDSLKRLQADFANYRRRTEEEAGSIKKRANEALLKEILNVNDNLETAIKHVPQEQQNEFYKGVKLIQNQIVHYLNCLK